MRNEKDGRSKLIRLMPIMAALTILLAAHEALAQTSAFAYTGRLTDAGASANGNYDMEFALFDSASVQIGSQVGSTITQSAVQVTSGSFSVLLDFGAPAFPGADRFLEITIRRTVAPPTPPGPYTTLSPRSQIVSTPYAIRASTVTGPISGTSPNATLTVTNDQPGIINPTLTNPGPSALRGEATSTSNSNAGVIGVADGSTGIGVLGFTAGNCCAGGPNAIGVAGISTSITGNTRGTLGQINSPNGIAVHAQSTTGRLFVGSSGPQGSEMDVFTVDAAGNLSAAGNFITTGLVRGTDVKSDGNLRAPDGSVFARELHLHNNTIDAFDGTIGMNGSVTITGALSVTGAKSSIAKLRDGRSVLLYAVESPENWFEDFGTIRLKHGLAWVPIDKTFAETTNVGRPYEVFLTPDGNCRGLYIARKTSTGFEVRELRGGHSSVSFDYRIVARRKGYETERFADAPAMPSRLK